MQRKREAREKLLEAARRREIDVVLVWRLDRWGRSVTDLLATLQELEHLGVGFVSLTEALDLTTPAGRAMAGLLAIFAEFEREILRERTRAGLAQARQNGKRLGRPVTAGLHALRSGNCIALASANPKSPADCKSAALRCAGFWADLFLREIGRSGFPAASGAKNEDGMLLQPHPLLWTAIRNTWHAAVCLSWQSTPGGTGHDGKTSSSLQRRTPHRINRLDGAIQESLQPGL